MVSVRTLSRVAVLLAIGAGAAGCAAGSPPAGPAPAAAAAPGAVAVSDTSRLRRERPVPYPVMPPPEFLAAVERGTRTLTGRPGPGYWQQWATYDLTARLDPARRRVDGTARIVYHNRSPSTLPVIFLHLDQNLHAPGAMRNEPQEVTGGVMLDRVAASGRVLDSMRGAGRGYAVDGTRLAVRLPAPLVSGDSAVLELAWHFVVPQSGAGRMGYSRDDLFHIAYWYPRVAVFDDVGGWHLDPYLGTAEFYSGFGSYRLAVTAPEDWIVVATGALENGAEVLTPATLERLRTAAASDTTVVVVPHDGAGAGRATRDVAGDLLTWRFTADTVRDAAFSATRASRWDARRTPVGDRDGDGSPEYARIDALWRAPAPRWARAAEYGAHAIDFLSRWTGVPYPWPHMTLVEGADIIGGGMEFPMLTLIGDYNAAGDTALYNVVAHELAHMWVPMIVGTDESRHAWMDEGTTTFNENQARKEFHPGTDHELADLEGYIEAAAEGEEGELMRWSNFHYTGGRYGLASYGKPATLLRTLRGVLGDSTFTRGLREYFDRWRYRHPTPWDMFATFDDVAGRELDWFWRSWYYETWTLDQAVRSVAPAEQGTRIVIEDRGLVPMPVRLAITRADGSVERREIPVDVWLGGAATTTVTVSGDVTQVEIDPERLFPDVDPGNNVWPAGR